MSNTTSLTNYTDTALAEGLHKWPHYDIKFHAVSSTFAPQNTEYQEALIQIAWPMAAVAVLIILRGLMLCCCCSKTKKKQITTQPNLNCSKISSIFFLLVVLGAMAVCYVGNQKVNEGADNLRQQASDAGNDFHEVLATINTTSNSAESVATLIFDTNWPDQYRAQARNMSNFLYQAAASLGNVYGTADKYNPTFLNGDIKYINNLRSIGTLVFTSIVAAVALIAIFANCTNKLGFISFCIYTCMLGFLVCWLVASAEMPLSVAGADFCVAPDEYAVTKLNSPTATYYIRCNGTTSDPYYSQLILINSYIEAAENYLQEIEAQSNTTYPNITTGLTQLNTSIVILENQLSCNRFHNAYESAATDLCGDGLEGVVYMMAGHIAAGLMLLLAAQLLRRIYENTYPGRGYYVSTPEEAQRLLFSMEERNRNFDYYA